MTTAKQAQRTPGPYHVGIPNTEEGEFGIHGENWIIADACPIPDGGASVSRVNADFIVRACNSHDALVAALRDLLADVTTSTEKWAAGSSVERARAALAAAGVQA